MGSISFGARDHIHRPAETQGQCALNLAVGPCTSCNVLMASNFELTITTTSTTPSASNQSSNLRNYSNIHFSMARTQSQKRRLLEFVKPSNSTSGLASWPGRSEARAGDLASVPATIGMASPGMLARMKRFFNRSNQGPSTTIAAEIAGPGTSGGAQKEQEQSQAAPGLDAVATSSGDGAQAQQETSQTVSTKNVEKSIVKPEPEHAPTSAGKDVDAALEGFGGIDRIPRVAQGAVVAVGNANTTFSEIQNLSDTYLKPFKVFNEVVSTLAHVHPYAQIALGILTSAAQTARYLAFSTRCEASTNSLRKKIA
ncbi:hypothetical protein BKA82DRAFT_2395492 [Pisolithus tinctorius]|nr:hypothetical protein BKA82DRAFT_2395492 [Pisolithus tinctorius]